MQRQRQRSPGDRIDRYTLVRRLGSGASGDVWEATLEGPGGFRKPVALKLLRAPAADEPALRALLREARLGALLQHPNVVATYGVGQFDGYWHVALELVRGSPLTHLLRDQGPLAPAQVIDVGVQVAAALAHIHELAVDGVPAGLVHRDVKPANLLVDHTGLVKLGDLGISLLRGEDAGPAGTPGYMPPEQADRRPEPGSDLFALGVTLYVIATGRRPYGMGRDAVERVRRADPAVETDRLRASVDAVMPGLGDVLAACLCADPAGRPQSARLLGDQLSALRSKQPAGPTLAQLFAVRAPSPARRPSEATTLPRRPVGRINAPVDAFVGREAELEVLGRTLRDSPGRVLVLAGTGGVGKTRLALEVALRLEAALVGGAWVFDLAEVRSPEGIGTAVAEGFGLQLVRSDVVGYLGRSIAARGRALFVLDNVEGCLPHLPSTLGRWCEEAPEATFLVASRVPTRLPGERTFPVETLSASDGLALLLARSPRALASNEGADAAQLCADLDGHALAIELAAARLRTLTTTEVRARLGLALLSGGGPERPERQRSLGASLAGSWDLLTPVAQTALGQLSVFEGGFTLEAAEAVLDLRDLPGGAWAVDVLHELVDAGLLRVEAAHGRFRMLAVVRAFASEQPSGAQFRSAEARHGAFFAQAGAPEAIARLHGLAAVENLAALALEFDNLVAACRRATARGDARTALATLEAAWEIFLVRGLADAGATLAVAVEGIAVDPHDRGAAALLVARAMWACSRLPEARTRLEEALALAQEHGDRRIEGTVLNKLGELRRVQGAGDEGRDLLERALALHRELGDRRMEAIDLACLGLAYREQGRGPLARATLEAASTLLGDVGDLRHLAVVRLGLGSLVGELGDPDLALELIGSSLTIHREFGNQPMVAVDLGALGNIHLWRGQTAQARAHYEQALALHREYGNRLFEADVLGNLGVALHQAGEHAEADATFRAARALHRELGHRRGEAMVLSTIGAALLERARLAEARVHLDEALALHRGLGDPRYEGIVLASLAELHLAEGRVDDARGLAERAVGLLRASGDRVHEALALLQLARVAGREGRHAEAELHLARSEELLSGSHDHDHLANLRTVRAEVAALGGG